MSKHPATSSKAIKPDISSKPASSRKIIGIGQKNVIPPILQEVGKLAAGVATIAATGGEASGSATGNPRNKHALSPGHSLMDWIRLGNSGTDLTGVGNEAGRLSITPKELAKHNTETDAWIAIRGKVFNITHYIPYHPGGPEEIMRGAGTDATKLFEQVHAWVNYESLLQKCYVGSLVALDPNINAEELFFGTSKAATNNNKPSSNKFPKKETNSVVSPIFGAKIDAEKESKTFESYVKDHKPCTATVSDDKVGVKTKFREPNVRKPETPDDIKYLKERILLPRFDWIQKTDYITIIFYTKALSNPQVEICPPNQDNVLFIYLTYEHQVFTNEITFSKSIHWPCQTKLHHETGKVEIIFKKTESKIWENYGVLKQKSEDEEKADNLRNQFRVISKRDITYNTVLIELERLDRGKLIVPLGKHVKIYGKINGEEMSRSYTPVPRSLFTNYRSQTYVSDNICLAVKGYQHGNISRYIHSKKIGDSIEASKGIGSFCLKDLEGKEIYLLLAGGTGITPMLSLLLFLIERRIRRCQKVLLVFFNQSERDILFKEDFDNLGKDEDRFQIMYVLSNPDSKWTGPRGRISSKILRDAINTVLDNTAYKQNDIFAMVCGPTAFTQLTENFLFDAGFGKDQMHLFLG